MADLSFVAGPCDTPLLDQTIGAALRDAAGRFGTADAIVSLHENRKLSYVDLDRAADRAAKALLACGVVAGDRVAIWSANRIDWLVAHHGAVRIGAIVVTVNPAYRSEEVHHLLDDAGVAVLFAAPGFRAFSYFDAIRDVRSRLPLLREVIVWADAAPAGCLGWERFIDQGAYVTDVQLATAIERVTSDMPCSLQYTSGTTGRPKGALLSHHSILNNGAFTGQRQEFSVDDRICLPVPFFHCFGLVVGGLAAIVHGCALILPGESFDPVAALKAVERERCTAIYGVPMMFIAMLAQLDQNSFDLSTLRTGVIGAAPCPLEMMTQAITRMNLRELTVAYGMTETSPLSFQSLPADDAELRCTTAGAIHPHVACKIVDPVTGATVPRGEVGEVCVRGYSVMLGYWRNPEATAQAIDFGGWMHSGDLGTMREDGYVTITGRIKDTIIRGGENIYPREIEEFLIRLPGVEEVYVFGIPDPTYGEEVAAWVRPAHGHAADAGAIREQCRGHIASYKIPKLIRIVTAFPVTASGKAQKFRMREIEIAEHSESR